MNKVKTVNLEKAKVIKTIKISNIVTMQFLEYKGDVHVYIQNKFDDGEECEVLFFTDTFDKIVNSYNKSKLATKVLFSKNE